MLKNTLKRTASCLLAIMMIVTTFFVFDPSGIFPTAGAAITAPDEETPEVYIVVPETFYMTPSLTTSLSVQYYINNTLNGSTVTPDEESAATTGKIWFNVSDGTVTDLRYSIMGTNKTNVPMNAGSGAVQLSDVILNVGMEAASVQTLEWIFTCSIDGKAAEYHAYSVAYAPYYTPVGAAANAKNANAGTQMQGIAWISGVHGYEDCEPTTAAATDKDNYVIGDYHARTEWDGDWNRPLVPMITSITPPTNNDENIWDWLSTSATGACSDATFTLYDVDKKASGTGAKSIDLATQSHIADITVDVSRNHSFTTVPNVTTGFFVSDLKRDPKYMGSYGGYIANYAGDFPGIDFWFSRNHYGDGCGAFTATEGVDTAFFGGNTSTDTGVRNYTTDDIPYNGVWNRATPTAAGTSMQYIHAAMCCEYENNWIYINIYLFVNVTAVDKTALRSKVFQKQSLANAKITDDYAAVREKLEAAYLALGDPTATQAAIDSASAGLDSISSAVRNTETVRAQHVNQMTGETFAAEPEQLTVRRSDSGVTVAPNSYTGYSYTGMRRTNGTASAFGLFDANAWAQSDCFANGSGVASVEYDAPSRMITVNNSGTQTYTAFTTDNVLNSNYACMAVEPYGTYTIDFDYASACDGRIGIACYDYSGRFIATTVLTDSFKASGGTSVFRHHSEIFCPASDPYLFGLEKRFDVHYITLTFGIAAGESQQAAPAVFRNVSVTANDDLFDLAQWNGQTSSFRSSTNAAGIQSKSYDSETKTLTITGMRPETNTSYTERSILTDCEVSGNRYYPWNFIPVQGSTTYAVEGEYAGTGNGKILIVHYNVNGDCTAVTQLSSASGYGGILAGTGDEANFDPFYAVFTSEEDDVYISLAFGGNNNPYATAYSTVVNVFRDVKVHAAAGDDFYTLYYRPNPYTVSFDANGGIGTMADQAFAYSVAQNLRVNTYTCPGCSFAGWSATAGGSKVYEDGESVVDLTTVADGEVRLYACWTAESYTIRYDAAGGEITGSLVTDYDVDTEFSLPNAHKDGYTLTGWRADDSGNWGQMTYKADKTMTGFYGDVLLTAVWKNNTYSVAFNPNGGEGTAMANQSFVYGTAQQLTANVFSRTGYTFLGWALTSDATEPDYTDKERVQDLTVEGDVVVTLYAVWGANTYTILYSTDDGEIRDASYTTVFTINDQIRLPLTVERTGYNFGGWKAAGSVGFWNTDVVYSGTLNSGMIGNVTLQAQWTTKEYMILYALDNGAFTSARYTTTYDIDDSIVLPGAKKTGYVFNGWQADGAGNWRTDVLYLAGNVSAGRYGDVTLTAQYTGNQYYVRFNGNGSTGGTMYNQSLTYGESTALHLNEYVRNGHTFLGWSLSETASVPTYADGGEVLNLANTVGTVVTIYAVWEKNSYTIGYDANGGTITVPGTTTFTITDTITLPTVARRGYDLEGWSPLQNNGSWHTWDIYNNSIAYGCYGDVTLTAKWSKNTYTITYDAADGTMSGGYTTSYDVDTTIVLPTVTRTGYTFGGWQSSAEWNYAIVTDTAPADAAGNVTLRAIWNANTYYIRFHPNGGSGEMNDEAFRFDESKPLTLNAFVRDGYNFTGWASSENGQIIYLNGDEIFNLTRNDGAVFHLFAVWSARSFAIVYDLNGADGSLDNTTVVMDGAAKTLRAYNQEETLINGKRYAFLGWSYTPEGAANGVVNYANRASFRMNESVLAQAEINWAVTTPTVTLYAVWSRLEIRLIVPEGAQTVIDTDRHFIYGLPEGVTKAKLTTEYLGVIGNGELIVEGIGAPGTGTVVKLVDKDDPDEVLETYEIVIFGDINCDGLINSTDYTEMRKISAGLETVSLDTAKGFACDLFPDGDIGPTDLTMMRAISSSDYEYDQVNRTYA